MDPVFSAFTRVFHRPSRPGSPGTYKAHIGDNFRSTQKTTVRNMGSVDQVRMGRAVSLFGATLTCHPQGEIQIGNEVRMGPGVRIVSCKSITIGNYCLFTRDVSIDDTDGYGAGAAPIRIGNDVWVADGAVILKGVSLGNGCVVAPGSVVTRSFPAFSLVAGNPAEFVRKVINIHV